MSFGAIRTSAIGQLPAIVLAAGLSSRMGLFKPLLTLGGEPLIQRVIDALVESGGISDVIVVTGYRGEELTAAQNRECE